MSGAIGMARRAAGGAVLTVSVDSFMSVRWPQLPIVRDGAMTPISARCAQCESEFPLFLIVQSASGVCPNCLRPLVVGDPGALLDYAAMADAAQYRLSAAVRLLKRLRGNLIVDWGSVRQSIGEEIPGNALLPRSAPGALVLSPQPRIAEERAASKGGSW